MPVPNLFRTIISGIGNLFGGGNQGGGGGGGGGPQPGPGQFDPNVWGGLTPGQQQEISNFYGGRTPPPQGWDPGVWGRLTPGQQRQIGGFDEPEPTFDTNISPESGIHHVIADIGGRSQTFFGRAIDDLPQQILENAQVWTNAAWESFQAMSPQERAAAMGMDTTQQTLPISNLQDFQPQQIQPGILGNIGATSRQIEESTLIGSIAQLFMPELTPGQQTASDRVRGALALTGALTSIGAGFLVGPTVGGAVIHSIGTPGTAGFISAETLGKIAINPKTITFGANIISKIFSKQTLVFLGGWATLVFFGRWAEAEGAEGITFPLNKAYEQGKWTGDWSVYDQYYPAALEMTDVEKWEEVNRLLPTSAFTGTGKKLEGVRIGVQLINDLAIKEKEIQAERALPGQT